MQGFIEGSLNRGIAHVSYLYKQQLPRYTHFIHRRMVRKQLKTMWEIRLHRKYVELLSVSDVGLMPNAMV